MTSLRSRVSSAYVYLGRSAVVLASTWKVETSIREGLAQSATHDGPAEHRGASDLAAGVGGGIYRGARLHGVRLAVLQPHAGADFGNS